MNDTKLTGDISETIVQLELLKRGFNVLKPIGDRLPYDLAIDLDGKIIRLQIRTAYKSKNNNSYIGNIRIAKTNRKKYGYVLPDFSKIEYFVFVIQELNEIFVIPTDIIKYKKSSIYISSTNKHKKYLNNFNF